MDDFVNDGKLKIACKVKYFIVTVSKNGRSSNSPWQITITAPEAKITSKAELNQKQISSDKRMFEKELFTDFEVRVDSKVLKVHKSILASRSDVFNEMLTGDSQEAAENFVVIKDFDAKTMKELFRFMYSNEVENLNAIAEQLVYAAEKYQLDDLKEICLDSLVTSVSVDNVVDYLIIANEISAANKLFKKCLPIVFR